MQHRAEAEPGSERAEAAAPPPGPWVAAPASGTLYRHRDPGAAPYVEVGSRARRGDPLCVIVAMKMVRRVDATCDCVVEEILAGDGQKVERGAPLFRVRPA